MIFSIENIPLIILAFIWIIGAILQDLKRREVDNLWNFSLIGIALAYRLAMSIHTQNYYFFTNGILGFFIFIGIGNILYYARVFAGGDAKLLIALGAILPLSFDWITNFKIFLAFLLLFLIGGAIYVLIWALILMVFNFKRFKKEFIKQTKKYKKLFRSMIFLIIFLIIINTFFHRPLFLTLPILLILFPILMVFAKSVEEVCMVKSISPSKLTVGDWLYKDITVKNKKIKSNWEGVSKKELKLIQKEYKKNIIIKQGVPFTPGFLIGLILLLVINLYYYSF